MVETRKKNTKLKAGRKAIARADDEHIERKVFVDPRHYPPGDLPRVAQDEVRRIADKPITDDSDIDILQAEADRAQRKIGWFRNLNDEALHADAKAREASATASYKMASFPLIKSAKDGAKIQRARRSGGQKTAQTRKVRGEETRRRVIAEYLKLEKSGKPSRDRAVLIATRVRSSPSQVRRILAADKKARTS